MKQSENDSKRTLRGVVLRPEHSCLINVIVSKFMKCIGL